MIYRPILSDQLHGCVESILQSRQYHCVHIYTGNPLSGLKRSEGGFLCLNMFRTEIAEWEFQAHI